jgi:hypothetical protein
VFTTKFDCSVANGQATETFAWDEAPSYLLRDLDRTIGLDHAHRNCRDFPNWAGAHKTMMTAPLLAAVGLLSIRLILP